MRGMSLTMLDLLKEPVYRKYFLKAPRFPYPIAYPTPWKVWVNRESRKPDKAGQLVWVSVSFTTFKEAFDYCKSRMREWEDFSICCTVMGFVPPQIVRNTFELSDWCMRCRRAVDMRAVARHHALRHDIHRFFAEWPVCPFCGASDEPNFTLVRG